MLDVFMGPAPPSIKTDFWKDHIDNAFILKEM